MISTRGRYALRVMLDLAEHGQEGPVPLKDIAARQETRSVSEKCLCVFSISKTACLCQWVSRRRTDVFPRVAPPVVENEQNTERIHC